MVSSVGALVLQCFHYVPGLLSLFSYLLQVRQIPWGGFRIRSFRSQQSSRDSTTRSKTFCQNFGKRPMTCWPARAESQPCRAAVATTLHTSIAQYSHLLLLEIAPLPLEHWFISSLAGLRRGGQGYVNDNSNCCLTMEAIPCTNQKMTFLPSERQYIQLVHKISWYLHLSVSFSPRSISSGCQSQLQIFFLPAPQEPTQSYIFSFIQQQLAPMFTVKVAQ